MYVCFKTDRIILSVSIYTPERRILSHIHITQHDTVFVNEAGPGIIARLGAIEVYQSFLKVSDLKKDFNLIDLVGNKSNVF